MAIRDGVRGGEVDGAGEFFLGHDPEERLDEVGFVNPRDELSSIALPTAESQADQAAEDGEDASGIGAHGHGRAHENEAGFGGGVTKGGSFPCLGDLNAEAPGFGHVGFLTTELAGEVVVGGVIAVGVEGGGGGLQPEAWRAGSVLDGATDGFGGLDPGIEDQLAIAWVITAIDGSSGEIDDDIGTVDFVGPSSRGETVPEKSACAGEVGARLSAKNNDMVVSLDEGPGEKRTDLPGTTGDDYFHIMVVSGKNENKQGGFLGSLADVGLLGCWEWGLSFLNWLFSLPQS